VDDDLNATRLRRALSAARELAELRELADFPVRTAALLRELIPCEHSGYNAIDVESGRATVVADPQDSVFDGGPEVLAQFAEQNPIIARARSGENGAMRLSDHISRRELHLTELYNHVYRLSDLEYQLGVQLPAPRGGLDRPRELVGISLSRTHRDFSDSDRALLDQLRPLFAATLERLHELALLRALDAGQDAARDRWVLLVDERGALAWTTPAAGERFELRIGEALPPPLRRWLSDERARTRREPPRPVLLDGLRLRVRLVRGAYPELDALHLTQIAPALDAQSLRGIGLTRRQSEVMELALKGETSRQIAARLALSTRTVEKHFDAIYARLGVTSRSQAVLAAVSALTAP
jgi:DNA-binding CsgD family transcriptional regulator